MDHPYTPPTASFGAVIDVPTGPVPAGRGVRLGAYLLDSFLFSIAVLVPILCVVVFGIATGMTEEDVTAQVVGIAVMGSMAGFAVWLGLTIHYVKQNSQSIAKKMLGIKIVRVDGSPASLARIFWLRNFVNAVLGVVPLYGLIDILFIFSETRQCLHDKIADTIVVISGE
ncbi:MAG: RDD family protein [Acidobacteriaceae bacterium]|jgi:uncharacterized RDD family membrane protein YckC|nr:RDD family protein [Acidobacteriaceae bacterium]